MVQGYIDKKVQVKPPRASQIPDKKENSKIKKILEAIEKGKANLCP